MGGLKGGASTPDGAESLAHTTGRRPACVSRLLKQIFMLCRFSHPQELDSMWIGGPKGAGKAQAPRDAYSLA